MTEKAGKMLIAAQRQRRDNIFPRLRTRHTELMSGETHLTNLRIHSLKAGNGIFQTVLNLQDAAAELSAGPDAQTKIAGWSFTTAEKLAAENKSWERDLAVYRQELEAFIDSCQQVRRHRNPVSESDRIATPFRGLQVKNVDELKKLVLGRFQPSTTDTQGNTNPNSPNNAGSHGGQPEPTNDQQPENPETSSSDNMSPTDVLWKNLYNSFAMCGNDITPQEFASILAQVAVTAGRAGVVVDAASDNAVLYAQVTELEQKETQKGRRGPKPGTSRASKKRKLATPVVESESTEAA